MQYLKTMFISQMVIMLIFPAMLWAISNCEEANDYVTEGSYLDDIIHREQKKDSFQQALILCPNHPEAHNNLAAMLALENKNSEALYHYQQALKQRPDYPEAWIGIGNVYDQQNQWPLSFEAYLQICTTHLHARQRVAELLRNHRYRTVTGEVILNQDSLMLLYDKRRLQHLHQLTTQCRNHNKSVAANVNTVRAILQPIVIFQPIHLKMEQHDLSLVSEEQLDYIAMTLDEIKAKNIIIRGHSSSQPFKGKTKTESYRLNWQLSQNRAKWVKSALNQRGIPDNRIKIYAYGDSRPLVKDNNESAWAKNRRVELEVNY
jgi:outer membrane protein OmpA-like peptidoglycan-associated protein